MRSLIKMLAISLLLLSMPALWGCASETESANENRLSDTAATEVNTDKMDELPLGDSSAAEATTDDDLIADQPFYGVWRLERVVLVSLAYSEVATEPGIHPYDTEDYLGFEFEYRRDFFRRGGDVCDDPLYDIDTMTVESFDLNNKFNKRNTLQWDGWRLSDPIYYNQSEPFAEYYQNFESFIKGEEINTDGWAECYYDTPLLQVRIKFEFDELQRFYDIPGEFQAKLDENPHLEKYVNPVGRDILLLNEDAMLIGTWGKIILARRIAL